MRGNALRPGDWVLRARVEAQVRTFNRMDISCTYITVYNIVLNLTIEQNALGILADKQHSCGKDTEQKSLLNWPVA